MALDRFTNRQEILDTNGTVRGIVWNEIDQKLLQLDVNSITPEQTPIIELHAYTPSEDYIAGGPIESFELKSNELYINYYDALKEFDLTRGLFEVVVNVQRILLGVPSEDSPLYIKEISPDRREVYVSVNLPTTEDDKADLPIAIAEYLEKWGKDSYIDITYDEDGNESGVLERPISQDIAMNLGRDNIFKIINQKSWGESHEFVIRLYKPLPATINEKMSFWIVEELADSYVDNVNVVVQPVPAPTHLMPGPNFAADTDYNSVTETEFKTWDEILDTTQLSSQQILDRIFSGSFGKGDSYNGPNDYDTAPPVDYSGFQNFIHYSSAKERVVNFKYKLQLIEYYEKTIGELEGALGTDEGSLQGNISKNIRNKSQVIGGMDGFEKWLYEEPTSSLYTHFEVYDDPGVNIRSNGGFIGAHGYTIQPWPKLIKDGKWVLHHSSGSLSTSWYDGVYSSASLYDSENEDQLINTIPGHIQSDENNSQYIMYINMMAHHFDVLYSYIRALTTVPVGEEHPELGANKHLLYEAAKGMGWQLANGKQASQLWQYTLGKSGSGEYQSTGTLFSKSDEDITTDVWRRIVNNLPYLLKTKGTTRGIKALMNTYGIPQTLLSIREYGGPKIDGDAPALIEDRFSYALRFDSGSINGTTSPYIKYTTRDYTTDIDDWGFQRQYLNSGDKIPVQTREWRFRPAVKENMLLNTFLVEGYGAARQSDGTGDERIKYQMAIEYTGSYSGSSNYGRVIYSHATCTAPGVSGGHTMTGSTGWLPLYDGEFWNIRSWWNATGSAAGIYNQYNNLNTTYHIQVQKASDYISGKIIHQSSASYTPDNSGHPAGWGKTSADVDSNKIIIGGYNAQSLTRNTYGVNSNLSKQVGIDDGTGNTNISSFSGSIQEYREWMEELSQESFDYHTLNPSSYVSTLHPSASYDTLVRHYPLGTDLLAIDRSTGPGTILSSSHPAQAFLDMQTPYHTNINDMINSGSSYATMSYFPSPANAQRGNYVPVEETYYIQGISLGGNNPRSKKIRLEENKLIRPLSVNSTSERSSYDYAPIDSNRLGLFYSMADQINKDIFNHVGDVELDDYVGDPSDEFEMSYPSLSRFADQYWKKYTNRNDINSYIRVFSLYDFSLFNQIKQLMPARANLASGLLVEPNALERSKVKIANKPVKTEPWYTASLQYMDIYDNTNPRGDTLLSGVRVPLSSSVEMPFKNITGTTVNFSSSNGYYQYEYTMAIPMTSSKDEEGNSLSSILARDNNIFNGTVYKHISVNFPWKVDPVGSAASSMPYEVTMSRNILEITPTGSVIYDQRDSEDGDMYQINYYHSTSLALSKQANTAMRVTSMSMGTRYDQARSWHWSQSLTPAPNRTEYANIANQRYDGCRLTADGINETSIYAAISYKPIIEVFEVNANQLVYTQNRRLGNLDVQ